MNHQIINQRCSANINRTIGLILFLAYAMVLSGQNSSDVRELFIRATVMESTDRDSSIHYWTSVYNSLDDSENINYKGHIALILSKAYNGIRQCDSIDYWNRQAKLLYQEVDDLRGLGEVWFQDAYYAFCEMDYELALNHTLRGLSIMEELGDSDGIALGHLRMSRIFHFTSKLIQSAEYGLSAGERFDGARDHINAWDAWSFAGHALRMQEDSLGAMNAFNKGMAAAERSQIESILGMAYNDLAAFHMEWDHYNDAEGYFIKSLEIADPADERQIMVIKNGLSQVYLHTGRYQQCIAISKEALETVYKIKDLFFLTELPEYIAKSYEGLQQYDSAYKYMKLNWAATDSLFTANQEETLEEMRTKYETEKKEGIISRQEREQLFGLALMAALAGIILVLVRSYRSKNKMNKILEERNEEKDFLLKEIHHRVKNNLQILSSLLSLQSDSEEDSMVLGALQESRNRVESMGLIHQKLYTKENLTSIHMAEYIDDLCSHLTDSLDSHNQQILINSDIQVGLVDVETAIPLGLIINELITNSFKYAFQNMKEGLIHVELWEKEGKELILQVCDNGKAASALMSNAVSTNFGSRLIDILCKKLKGKLNINKESGYQITIVFERYKLT